MIRESAFERLTAVFRETFDGGSIVITDATTAADIEEWDSLGHINLIVAIEEAFGMKFTMREVTSMRNVGEMISIIVERGTK
jgi:acyl carrier protein